MEKVMKYQVWTCKIIVPINAKLPWGFDAPPRQAAIEAIENADIEVISCFSGWGGEVDEAEKTIIEERKL